jgi:hypothetical protein
MIVMLSQNTLFWELCRFDTRCITVISALTYKDRRAGTHRGSQEFLDMTI